MSDIKVITKYERDAALAAIGRVVDNLQDFGTFQSSTSSADVPAVYEATLNEHRSAYPTRREDMLTMDVLTSITKPILHGFNVMRDNTLNSPLFAIQLSADLGRKVTSTDLFTMFNKCENEFAVLNLIYAEVIKRAAEVEQQKQADDEIIWTLEKFFEGHSDSNSSNNE